MATASTHRAAHLIRTIQAALAALDDFRAKSPAEAAEIYAHVAAHMRSAAPMAFAALPVEVVAIAPMDGASGELPDGCGWRLGTVGEAMTVTLVDHDGDLAVVSMDEPHAGAFGRDFARVLARLGDLAKAAR